MGDTISLNDIFNMISLQTNTIRRKETIYFSTTAIGVSLVIFSTAAVNYAFSTRTSIQPARGGLIKGKDKAVPAHVTNAYSALPIRNLGIRRR
jgi:hypothetical protein